MVPLKEILEASTISTEGGRLIGRLILFVPHTVKQVVCGISKIRIASERHRFNQKDKVLNLMEDYIKHTRLTARYLESIEKCLIIECDSDIKQLRASYRHLETTCSVVRVALDASREQINCVLFREGRGEII